MSTDESVQSMDTTDLTATAHARADAVARASYSRLLAILAARDGDIAAAEDCLSEAFAKALAAWPTHGVPDRPEAWLLTVARNRRLDEQRAAVTRHTDPLGDPHMILDRLVTRTRPDAANTFATLEAIDGLDEEAIPDRRLALLFVCAHPAIDASVRTPLMLQTVLGYDAEQIARAFVMPTATMAQRLVRAKRRIRDTRIPFVVPERAQLPSRLPTVLEAIYGAYAIEYSLVAGEAERDTLPHEALYLARLLAELMPHEAEVQGLLAMLALSLARRPAMLRAGVFVPLDEQDPSRWDRALIAEGRAALQQTARAQTSTSAPLGRFVIEAAIQASHSTRVDGTPTDWERVLALHSALLQIAPTLGARVAHAAAVGRVHGPLAGLDALDVIARDERTKDAMARFQPAWATRAHLLAAASEHARAREAYTRAISLTTDVLLRDWLVARSRALDAMDA